MQSPASMATAKPAHTALVVATMALVVATTGEFGVPWPQGRDRGDPAAGRADRQPRHPSFQPPSTVAALRAGYPVQIDHAARDTATGSS
jgi:hypothetical protein